MSKQEDAKTQQGYEAKPLPTNCSACKHYTSEMKLPDWIEQAKANGEKSWSGHPYSIETHGVEKNLRCGLGGFAIKKTALCKQFERAPAPKG